MKITFKLVIVAMLCALSLSANTMEIKGVKVEESAQVGGDNLLLNGAGVRTKLMFKVYVAALYLAQKQTSAEAALNELGKKRVSLHFLRDLSAEKLLHAMEEGFAANNSVAEMATIDVQMKSFRQMMTAAKEVKQGDVILLDYIQDSTYVSLNGKTLGNIDGSAFNQALLKVWLGKKPVDASLKNALLGQ